MNVQDHCTEPEDLLLEAIKARTAELAAISGRVPPQVTQLEYEQAKRELQGRQQTGLRQFS